MTRTPEQQRQHDEDSARCTEALKGIGRAYGRVIMQAVIAAELDIDQINAGIEAAIADTRDFLTSNGVCEQDVEISIDVVRRAIIAEGKTIAVMLPDHAGGIH